MLFGAGEFFGDGHVDVSPVLKALGFLRERGTTLGEGRHDMDEGVFVTISTITPGDPAGKLFETHAEYADLQYCIAGNEIIQVAPRDGLRVVDDRTPENDLLFLSDPPAGETRQFLLTPGAFLLLLSSDAHKPGCFAGGGECRKAVVKIPLAMLSTEVLRNAD